MTLRRSAAPVDDGKAKKTSSLHISSLGPNDAGETEREDGAEDETHKPTHTYAQNRHTNAAIPHTDKHVLHLGFQIICECMWA